MADENDLLYGGRVHVRLSERDAAVGQAVEAATRPTTKDMLREYHGHPHADGRTNGKALRCRLHREEHRELEDELDTYGTYDQAKIARELADVVYVAYGTALVFGIDLDVALAEIHRCAMVKLEANVRREDGKIVKPPGFVPPDMTAALGGAPGDTFYVCHIYGAADDGLRYCERCGFVEAVGKSHHCSGQSRTSLDRRWMPDDL